MLTDEEKLARFRKELEQAPKRTVFQCVARGCPGCLVCQDTNATNGGDTE